MVVPQPHILTSLQVMCLDFTVSIVKPSWCALIKQNITVLIAVKGDAKNAIHFPTPNIARFKDIR